MLRATDVSHASRLFKTCEMLNTSSSKGEIRFAAVGWLVYLHHSLHEVMIAAKNAGGGSYGNKCDYGELSPPGRSTVEAACGPIPADVPTV